jgi:hypothetical protein
LLRGHGGQHRWRLASVRHPGRGDVRRGHTVFFFFCSRGGCVSGLGQAEPDGPAGQSLPRRPGPSGSSPAPCLAGCRVPCLGVGVLRSRSGWV